MIATESRMPVAQRVRVLLDERDRLGRPLVFFDRDGAVHVVGPDEDQPGYSDVADYLISRRYRVVCGIELSVRWDDGYTEPFEDMRLCRRCRAAFGEDAAAIFEDNTERVQEGAAGVIESVRRLKQAEAERGARTTGSRVTVEK